MTAPTDRSRAVYRTELDDGRVRGTSMRTRGSFFDERPPSAYAETRHETLVRASVRRAGHAIGHAIEDLVWKRGRS